MEALNFLIQMEQKLSEGAAPTAPMELPTPTTSQATLAAPTADSDRKRKLSDPALLQPKKQKTITITPSTDTKEGFCFFGAKLL